MAAGFLARMPIRTWSMFQGAGGRGIPLRRWQAFCTPAAQRQQYIPRYSFCTKLRRCLPSASGAAYLGGAKVVSLTDLHGKYYRSAIDFLGQNYDCPPVASSPCSLPMKLAYIRQISTGRPIVLLHPLYIGPMDIPSCPPIFLVSQHGWFVVEVAAGPVCSGCRSGPLTPLAASPINLNSAFGASYRLRFGSLLPVRFHLFFAASTSRPPHVAFPLSYRLDYFLHSPR